MAGRVEGAHGESYADSPSSRLHLPVAGDRLSEKETEDLMAWMRNALGSRVTDVKVRLSETGQRPAAMTLRDHTAGQPAVSGLLAWRVLCQQGLEPWCEVETRHVTAPLHSCALCHV